MLSIGTLAAKIFGTSSDRKLKVLRTRVDEINRLEDELQKLSDAELRARTAMFRAELREGKSLDDILVPAFATVREAAKRTLGQRHFDVQMLGGMVLHQGNISEMKTGEGKTLVATLPIYLNALTGKGVHAVTVNDYLAKRDSEWMGAIYRFLGLTVGVIVHELDDEQRRENYACDVTYGTNNEFGFDYLRDNMKMSTAEMVQFGYRPSIRLLRLGVRRLTDGEEKDAGVVVATRQEVLATCARLVGELDRIFSRPGPSQNAGWPERRSRLGRLNEAAQRTSGESGGGYAAVDALAEAVIAELERLGAAPIQDPEEQITHHFAIVDEVDSILIDEARTPLIISGPLDDRSDLYINIDRLIPRLAKEDYEIDEKQKQVALTESGNVRIEELLEEADLLKGQSLYDIENVSLVHHVNQALKAHKLFQRDRDYIVKSGEVIIIDEFTGRMMQGRRYSEGLHQALEAKERVDIQPENQTLASITFQNYFRLYEKLAGMTGTAITEAGEFLDIYGLDVVEIPTNVPVARRDLDDEVYRTAKEKWEAIIREIESAQKRKQPVLVGTVSIEKSEHLANLLKERRIEHQVLNARYHEQEAYIIAQAGVPGNVTIATNMAGRGTDIQLGGNVQMRILQECAELPEGRERERKIAEIKADVERNKQIVLAASDEIELVPAKGNKPARTMTLPGGLYVIGTERHESRRIDNQLRGRSGRQGDPGRTKFYLSLEDDLMRIFAAERIDGILKKLGLEEGEAIVHPWINKALENAQRKVEARNFDARKHVLKYDDVMNDQRKVIFDQRLEIMGTDDVNETVTDMRQQVLMELVAKHIPENAYAEQWDVAGLKERVHAVFGLDLPIEDWAAEEGIADVEIRERLTKEIGAKADAIAVEFGNEILKVYASAKELQRFVHDRAPLKGLLENDPLQNLAAIGRALISSNSAGVQISGGTLEDAEQHADRIGMDFFQQFMQAKGLTDAIDASPDKSPKSIGFLRLRDIEKSVLLQTLDSLWREHLVTLEHLRQVIGFRSYGQRDPLNEYKSEGFQLFEGMLARLREDVTGELMHIKVGENQPLPAPEEEVPLPPMQAHHINPMTGEDEFALAEAVLAAERAPPVRAPSRSEPVKARKANGAVDPQKPETWGKVSRNAPCPCGSGKKYKHCHGRH